MKRNAQKWTKIAKTEIFNLFQSTANPMIFEVSWKRSRGYGRRRFQAQSFEAAMRQAPKTAGLVSSTAGSASSLMEAFSMALQNTSRGLSARQDWLYSVERFLRWLASVHSDCTHWHLLTRTILREYLATYDGRSANTKRLALQPIIQTAGFMSREFDYKDIGARLGLSSQIQSPPAEVYLIDVVDFLAHLRRHNPRLEAGAALQGLAGLQLQEGTRLTWDRVDLERGLIEISGEVKNKYRNRVIPVANSVREALGRCWQLQQDRLPRIAPIHPPVLMSRKGFSYVKWWHNYSQELQQELKAWNPKIDWKPKDLRNCLPTFAVEQGLLSDVWEQYIGHAPRSVTARHYIPRLASASLGEREALDRQIGLFRFHVIEPLEKAIKGKKDGEFLKNFERKAAN